MNRLRIVLALLFVCRWMNPVVAADRPNVLFIIADDHCFQNIGALGYTDIETPNLDRLVKRGTTFTHAYNMGSFSGAVCVASRAMLVSGRSVWRASAIYNTMDQLREAGQLWPQRMEQQGYATYFTGKWHIKADPEKTFQHTKHIRGGMPKDGPEAYNRPLTGQPDPWSPTDTNLGGFWEGGRHWSEVVADDAIEFLNESSKATKPAFYYVAFNAPHDPRQSPPSFVAKYPLERIALPRNFQSLYPYYETIGCDPTLRDEKLAPFPRTEHAVKVHRQEYYAAITHLDSQVGRILDALDQTGLTDKTWVFFTADHGLAVGQHGLMGKQNLYDHSVRVPFLVAGPGVPVNQRIDAPIYLQDAMATSLELAQATPSPQNEFQTLMPLLKDPQFASRRKAIYGAYLELQRSVTHDGWKLILYPKANAIRLYHVADDPDEMVDLAKDAAQQIRIRELFAQLRTLQRQFDDGLDLTAVFPTLASQ